MLLLFIVNRLFIQLRHFVKLLNYYIIFIMFYIMFIMLPSNFEHSAEIKKICKEQ